AERLDVELRFRALSRGGIEVQRSALDVVPLVVNARPRVVEHLGDADPAFGLLRRHRHQDAVARDEILGEARLPYGLAHLPLLRCHVHLSFLPLAKGTTLYYCPYIGNALCASTPNTSEYALGCTFRTGISPKHVS